MSDATPTTLAALALRALTQGKAGEERFVLGAPALEALRAGIDATLAAKTEAKRALEDLLRLAEVLEKNGAPSAAAGVLQLVASNEVARAVLGAGTTRAKVATAEFARFKGEVSRERAPVHGSRAPAGSLKASSFLEPGRERRAEPSRVPASKVVAHRGVASASKPEPRPMGMRLR